MERLGRFFTGSKRWVMEHPFLSAFFVLVLGLFLLNSRYVDYPDEYVNLLAGKSILHFGLPYKDVWDHHLPGAWYLASVLLFFSGGSFVVFRVLWALFTFAGLAVLSYILRKEEPWLHKYYLIFFFLYPLAALYFWFHLYLADSLAVYFFSLSFWLLLERTLHPAKTLRSYYLVSFLIFLMIFSSATFVYIGAVLYVWLLYLALLAPHGKVPHDTVPKTHRIGAHKHSFKLSDLTKLLPLIIAIIIPYIVYVLILLVTGTFKDFYFANFVYNTTLYISIPNYVRGAHFNPVKFAMTIIANFFDGYLPLLSKIKYFDLYLPIGTLAGLSTLTLLLILFTRSWVLGILFFFVLSFSAPRSNIQNYKETDYQSAMFLVLGLISAVFVLYLLEEIEKHQGVIADLKRAARFLIAVFLIFTAIFLSYNAYSKAFQIYTQKLPTIHNRGEASGFIDEFVSPGETYFVGPYEPNEAFYVKNGSFPGKHVSLLPQFRESEQVKREFLSEFENKPPKIILFKQQSSIFGTPAVVFGKFFYDWMSTRYTQLEKVPGVKILRQPTGFDLKTDLFIRNDARDTVLKQLTDKGYITSDYTF